MQGSLLVLIKISDQFILLINIIVLIVAATVITNAILMNVFEKQREFGTLRAIGMRRRNRPPWSSRRESSWALSPPSLARRLPYLSSWYFQRHELSIGEASHIFGGGDVLYFGASPLVTLQNVGFGVLIAVAGSLYAALAGTRSSVVDALKNG